LRAAAAAERNGIKSYQGVLKKVYIMEIHRSTPGPLIRSFSAVEGPGGPLAIAFAGRPFDSVPHGHVMRFDDNGVIGQRNATDDVLT
jgi:hypothetical protein